MGIPRPVKKSCVAVSGTTAKSATTGQTYHQAISNVRRRAGVRCVLVFFLDHERVDHCGEPIDQLVQVHARSSLGALGRPVVFRKLEEVFNLSRDLVIDPRQGSGKRILK